MRAKVHPLPLLVCVLISAPLWVAAPAAAQSPDFIEVLPQLEHARQLELRGDLHALRKRYLEAIEYYNEALGYSPDNPILLNKLGIAYQLVLEKGKAEKFYKKAIRADKQYAQAWNNLGALQYGRRSFKSAVKSYLRALEVDPASATIRSNLGAAYIALERFDEAMEQYRLALMLDSDVFDRGSRFGSVVQEKPMEDRVRYNHVLARTFAAVGYISQALQYLRRAMEGGLTPEEIMADSHLDSLRGNPEYVELLANPPVVVE